MLIRKIAQGCQGGNKAQNMSCIILGDFNCNFIPAQHDCNAQNLLFYADMSIRPQELQTRQVQQLIWYL